MRSRCFVIPVLMAAFLVAVGGTAHAVAYEISVKNRNFCCDSVFIFGYPPWNKGYHTVVAAASQTGVAPQPIKIGMGHAAQFYSRYLIYLSAAAAGNAAIGPDSLHNDGYGTVSFSNGAGTLQKDGGNAAPFSFCPKNIGLPAPGMCTHPAKATPVSQGFNGRVKVTPGKNKFGGTLQILAGPGGLGGSHFSVYRLLGGPMMSKLPAALIHGVFKLAPIGAMTPGYVAIAPNPAMTGFPPSFNTMSYPNQALWEQGAGRFTTGMVTLQITMQAGLPVRSVMLAGYDNRTPGGLGNIQVVSGTLANGFNGAAPGGTPLGWKMRISVIPEPSASFGLAAGALALLLVGLLHARGAVARRDE